MPRLRGPAGSTRQSARTQRSALSLVYLYTVAQTGATERTIKQYVVHWRRTTGATSRIHWRRGCETWEQFEERRVVVTQTVADRWRELNQGKQVVRHAATWLGHASRTTGWPWRMLQWWTAEAAGSCRHDVGNARSSHDGFGAQFGTCCCRLGRAKRRAS